MSQSSILLYLLKILLGMTANLQKRPILNPRFEKVHFFFSFSENNEYPETKKDKLIASNLNNSLRTNKIFYLFPVTIKPAKTT